MRSLYGKLYRFPLPAGHDRILGRRRTEQEDILQDQGRLIAQSHQTITQLHFLSPHPSFDVETARADDAFDAIIQAKAPQVLLEPGRIQGCHSDVLNIGLWVLKEILRRLQQQSQVSKGLSTSPQATRCLLYTSPSPRDGLLSRMPSSA